MNPPSSSFSTPPRLFFDDFELRLDSGELLRDGAPVKIQPQPAKVLEVLASRSGEVVSREEIRQAVWGDSFVDFDASLNFCIKQIRRALDDSATEPRYIETVPKRGYRFLPPVRTETPTETFIESPAPPEPEEVEVPAPAVPAPAPRHRARWPWLAGLAAAGIALVIALVLVGGRRAGPSLSSPRLAVLPLECKGPEDSRAQICGAIPEVLTAELARHYPQSLEIIAPTSAILYGTSGKGGREIASALEATHLVSGRAELSGRQIRLTLELTEGDSGSRVWQESAETDLGDAPLLYEPLIQGLARALRLPPPPSAPAGTVQPPAEAYEAYLRGLYFLRQRQPQRATESLENAILLAPRFAPAYAALARARLGRRLPPGEDFLPATETAARRALELDPRLPEAHRIMADIALFHHRDWERAGREYRRALALSPGDAGIHHAYASYLSGLGRHDEAIASIRRARELDPASMLVGSDFAWYFYLARRYDEAMEQARATLELLPLNESRFPQEARSYQTWALRTLFYSAWQKGDEKATLNSMKAYLTASGVPVRGIETPRDFWIGQRNVFRSMARNRYLEPYYLANAAAVLGEKDQALTALEEQCRAPWGMMFFYTAADPVFDPLREDPRFARALDCLGLPAGAPARRGLQAGSGEQSTKGSAQDGQER